jgi:ubiquitin C-terminal hydrolase
MFGLQNFRGSCWVNTCIQAVFKIPEMQERYSNDKADTSNVIDMSLQTIWTSKGEEGLKQFFESVRTATLPAGHDIGDSHELFQYLCDKIPFLDDLVRFKIGEIRICNNCKDKQIREDKLTEFSISANKRMSIVESILNSTKVEEILEWKCELCKKEGCTKQQLIGSFPKVMVFHMLQTTGSVDYSSVLILNKRKYVLLSVSCYNGSHWWGYGRSLPLGTSWYTLDDTRIHEHGPKQFPISNKMRILIYYRLDN